MHELMFLNRYFLSVRFAEEPREQTQDTER